MSETVIQYLHRSYARDMQRGGNGLRTTREVADSLGVSLATARRRLWAAEATGDVKAYDGQGTGDPILWRIAP